MTRSGPGFRPAAGTVVRTSVRSPRPGGPRGVYQEADRVGVGADTPPLRGGAAPFGTRRVPKGPLSTRSIKALSPFLRRADLDGRLPVQYSVFVGCGLWCGGGGFGARLGR